MIGSLVNSNYDSSTAFYLACSSTNSVIEQVCYTCVEFLTSSHLPDTEFIRKAKLYTNSANKGGLKITC